jgi:ketosteroid isomerase-like protein
MSRSRFVGLALLTLTSCSAPQPSVDTADVRAAIDSTLEHHAQLFRSKDVAALLAAYTDSPTVYSNHTLPVRGRGALEPFLSAFIHGGNIISLSYTTEELAVYGDSAWQILTYRVSVQPTGATAVVSDSGAGFALWLRDAAGGWRIHRDIFNSSVPLPASPE